MRWSFNAGLNPSTEYQIVDSTAIAVDAVLNPVFSRTVHINDHIETLPCNVRQASSRITWTPFQVDMHPTMESNAATMAELNPIRPVGQFTRCAWAWPNRCRYLLMSHSRSRCRHTGVQSIGNTKRKRIIYYKAWSTVHSSPQHTSNSVILSL